MHWKNLATKLLPALLFAAALGACEKTNFTTKPQLTLEKVSDTVVRNETLLVFSFKLVDKEGDFNDTSAVLHYQRISQSCPNGNDTARFPFPAGIDATRNYETALDVRFLYTTRGILPTPGLAVISATGCSRPGRPLGNDTCFFKFWVRDQAKNVSDTVRTGRIVLVRP